MAIVTPHQSQAGIATANAGQAAPYRSASAFMTPGQAALPSGLNQLARGAEKLGDAVFRMGLDRMKMQYATDLLADKVAYEDALRQFDSDYRKTHLGASARDAEEAYAAFHQEQYDRLQKKWGGNPFLMEGVNRMAEGIRLPSMQKAVNYPTARRRPTRSPFCNPRRRRPSRCGATPMPPRRKRTTPWTLRSATCACLPGSSPSW